MIVYQDYTILNRIPYFNQQDLPLDPTKYPSAIPTVEWANYKMKNQQFGYFWFQVQGLTTKLFRFGIHFINDDPNEL